MPGQSALGTRERTKCTTTHLLGAALEPEERLGKVDRDALSSEVHPPEVPRREPPDHGRVVVDALAPPVLGRVVVTHARGFAQPPRPRLGVRRRLARVRRPDLLGETEEPLARAVEVAPAVPQAVAGAGARSSKCRASCTSNSSSTCGGDEPPARESPHAAESAGAKALVVQPPEAVHVLGVAALGMEQMELDEVVPLVLRLGVAPTRDEARAGARRARAVRAAVEVREADLGRGQVAPARGAGVERADGRVGGGLVPREGVLARLLGADAGPVAVSDCHGGGGVARQGGERVVQERLRVQAVSVSAEPGARRDVRTLPC